MMHYESKTIDQSKMMLQTLFSYIVNEHDKGNLLSHDIRISCYLYKRQRQKEYK